MPTAASDIDDLFICTESLFIHKPVHTHCNLHKRNFSMLIHTLCRPASMLTYHFMHMHPSTALTCLHAHILSACTYTLMRESVDTAKKTYAQNHSNPNTLHTHQEKQMYRNIKYTIYVCMYVHT